MNSDDADQSLLGESKNYEDTLEQHNQLLIETDGKDYKVVESPATGDSTEETPAKNDPDSGDETDNDFFNRMTEMRNSVKD